ncbi:DUF2157 domain-containing protein [Lewinella sp. 4G2]|uniref:DUF2157 domain-containing protein n=1 Tax=Lewinella sp. 4G2 TaxID=1803372 RepID=UPI0007B4D2E3|nr:DUF2157 domain-containing protein [Lewinella sp. 4G2]OAV45650.1 hypothetical protein A3850_014615 [Lewinella sp. 4G2]
MRNYHKYLLFLAARKEIDAPTYAQRLQENVEPNARAWQRFTATGLLAFGLGLLACGLIFLLAFNWDALSKWQKLTIAALGVATPTLLALTNLFSAGNRKILMTVAAFMVGGLFAVYGQIYQTGADAFEYFLAWTWFITIWAIVVDFPALWLIWLAAFNFTLYFYGEQMLNGWRTYEMLSIQFVLSALILLGLATWSRKRSKPYPRWFLNVIALAVATLGCVAIMFSTWHDDENGRYVIIRFAILIVIVLALVVGKAYRWLGLMASMALSLIVSIAVLIVSGSETTEAILIASFWTLGATTATVLSLNILRKYWRDEEDSELQLSNQVGAAAGAQQKASNLDEPVVILDPNEEPNLPLNPEDSPSSALETEYHQLEREKPSIGLQLLSLAGGLLAMVAIIAFLALAGLLDEPEGRLALGILFIGVGIAMDRGKQGDFLGALSVSGVTTGILLFIAAWLEWSEPSFRTVMLSVAVMCLVLLSIAKSSVLRVLLVTGMHAGFLIGTFDPDGGALQYLPRLYVLGMGMFLAAWMLLEVRIVNASPWLARRYGAIRTGTMVSLIAGAIFVRWVGLFSSYEQFYYPFGFPTLEWLLLPALYVAYLVLKRHWPDPNQWIPYLLGVGLLFLPFTFAPAAAPAILVIMLSVKQGYRLGLMLGIAAFLYFIGQFYYDLNISLLNKSFLLIGAGAFYLIGYAVVRKKLATDEILH